MQSPDTESDLLKSVAASDQQAFRLLYDQYARHVYGLSLRLVKSPEMAQDLTQEIFVKIWLKREVLAEVLEFRPWLNTVAKNAGRDYLRKKVLAPENDAYLSGFFSDMAPSAEEQLAFKQLENAVKEAVDQLSPQLKTAFTLSRFQGLTHQEIALQMNITPTTSKSHLVRALAIIRKYLAEHYPEIAMVAGLYLTPLFF